MNFFFFVSLFLFSFFFFGATQHGSKKEGDSCVTTRHEEGTCLDLNYCTVILNIVKYEPISSEFREYLVNSACQKDEEKHTIMLCCPLEFTRFQATAKPLTGKLLQHRNMRLLPLDTCGEALKTVRLNKDPEKNVRYYEYPWTALIARFKTQNSREISNCGGALINQNYVLGNPFCATNPRYPLLYVQLGEYTVENGIPKDCLEDENGEMICVPEWRKYHITNIIKDNDDRLVLLRLERPAYEVTPVCLPITSELLDKDYTGATFIGAGTRKIEGKVYFSNGLYKERLYNDDCVEKYLCISEVNNGDQYSPILLSSELFKGKWKYFLIGTHQGYINRRSQRVFHPLARYNHVKWILDNIKK